MVFCIENCSSGWEKPFKIRDYKWIIMLKKCGRSDHECFSPKMNNRHPWQLKKSKSWEPFWSYQYWIMTYCNKQKTLKLPMILVLLYCCNFQLKSLVLRHEIQYLLRKMYTLHRYIKYLCTFLDVFFKLGSIWMMCYVIISNAIISWSLLWSI